MRDEKDSATLDLVPAKRGRPCLDSDRGPLTPAERARRYRMQRRQRAARLAGTVKSQWAAEVQDAPVLQLFDALGKQVRLVEELKGGGRGGLRPAQQRVAALVAELSRRYPEKK